MIEERGYQGWTNYETWDVALWINNDSGTQEYFHELVRGVIKENDKGAAQTRELADALKYQIEQEAPDIEASMYSDLLSAAISSVDWYELAGSLIEDVKEMDAYEEEEEEEEDE